jgi:hypothetical protein
MKVFRFFIVLIFFLSLFSNIARATHIRAGEILVERISLTNYTYIIKVIIYSDRSSIVEPGGGTLNLGDGTIITNLLDVSDIEIIYLDNDIAKNIYSVTHTYANRPEPYTIGYQEINRNPGIMNMTNSVNTPFYTETSFYTDTPCGINNTPSLLIPPIDFASAGDIFKHNAGAYDQEGDSITYNLIVPKQSSDQVVDGYFVPENLDFDELSGEINWEVSNTTGEYNVAFEVIEWRIVGDNSIILSTTVRDMQIIVVDNLSNPPEITIPQDTCLVAGDFISETITADDEDGGLVKLEAFSQVFLFEDSPATMNPDSTYYDNVPVIKDFIWQTTDAHIASLPYKAHFKATDYSLVIPLTDIDTWKIMVSAPPPQNITASLQTNDDIRLTWDDYRYGADKIQIRRRIASYDIPQGSCITGIPDYSWYELVGLTEGSSTVFNDSHPEGRFNRGATYCYRLLATFVDCTNTESASSEEICVQIPVDAPVVTNVSVLDTHPTEGEVYIRWTSSFDIDTTLHNPNLFSYRLKRVVNDDYENSVFITPNDFTDTVFFDTGINTEDEQFRYTVYLYEGDVLIDSSAIASTIRLSYDPVYDKIGMIWDSEVSWSNNTQTYPYHHIYRDNISGSNSDVLLLMDSVNVNHNGFHYVDSAQNGNISSDGEYCYFVETYGSYGNPRILEPLVNRSQVFCASKYDTIPPCPPILAIENNTLEECLVFMSDKPCDFQDFSNNLIMSNSCEEEDIVGYNIYYSETGISDLLFLTYTEEPEYLHENLPSFIGCYAVSAVNFSGQESELSTIVCNDNCPNFELPNVFTPNEDGCNDVFTEFNGQADIEISLIKCPRFVKHVEFTVYNRYGLKVYQSTSENSENGWIEWNGIDDIGRKMSAGVYYYDAKVTYDVLDPENRTDCLKGWISILY